MSSFLDISFGENSVNASVISDTGCKTAQSDSSRSLNSSFQKPAIIYPMSPALSSVNSTNSSAYKSIEYARASRLKNAANIVEKVVQRKEKWKREKEWKKRRNVERQNERMKQIESRCEKMSEQRKTANEAQLEFTDSIKTAEREMTRSRLDSCRVQRTEMQRTLKEKKRQSIMIRGNIRDEADRNQRLFEQKKKQDELEALEAAADGYRDVAKYRAAEQENRRMSMAFRLEEAKLQKQIESTIVQSEKSHEKALIVSRHEGWGDMRATKARDADLRRQSMANRGLVSRRQHKEATESQAVENQDRLAENDELRQFDREDKEKERERLNNLNRNEGELADATFKRSAAVDLKKHDDDLKTLSDRCQLRLEFQVDDKTTKQEMDDLRRKSLQFRGLQHRYHMKLAEGEKQFMDTIREENESMKAMDRLAKIEYQEELKAAERQEMEYRTLEHHIHRQIEEGQQALRHEVQGKQRELNHSDVVAVNEAKLLEEKTRRESLQQRLDHALAGREIDEQERQTGIEEIHDMSETRRQMSKNRRDYADDLRKRARESLAGRRVYGQQQKVIEADEREFMLIAVEESRELDEEARQDVLDYLEISRLQDETDHLSSSFLN